MKRELTLTDIAGYLPYGLKLLNRKRGMTTVWEWQSAACCDWNGEEKVEMISGEKYSEELVMASPILRPMSDLFVKITERDYNDGKPFIPISELANIVEGQESARWVFEQEDKRMYSCEWKDWFLWDHDWKTFIRTSSLSSSEVCAISHPYKLYDLLHRLHLDYRGLILAGLAVSVHDLPTNPYEI